MIMVVHMSGKWVPDLGMLMKGLMLVMLVVHLEAIKVVHLVISQIMPSYAFSFIFFDDSD